MKVLLVAKKSPKLKHYHIHRGDNFDTIQVKAYHAVFLSPFKKKNIRIPLRVLVNALFKSRKDVQNFKKQVYESLVQDGFFVDSVFTKIYLYKRSKKGKACKAHLKSLLKSSEKELKKGDKDLNRLAETTSRLGLNIFLLGKVDSQLLQELSAISQFHSKENLAWNAQGLSHPYYDYEGFDSFDLGGGSFGDGGVGADGSDFDGGSDFY
ncbi:hypothetical protein [Catalinimonas niigatensis]|uniref:hypothetical protein n=1 Tax=Catalinimonas niigatensis TaxID=1397264 RepID=UPI0026662228|nr:hypothetical protein [Catalinimonas niigatensis]WPP49750.1 hypothetical protein PZB72_24055 [Catalinimonas niigatensis]